MSTEQVEAASDSDLPALQSMSQNGLVLVKSERSLQDTCEHLAASLSKRGIPLVARVDHAAAAHAAGMEMLPAELFIFGNPLVGTPVMRAAPSSAIDLPLKILVTGDSSGVCRLTYIDPLWIGRRHAVPVPQWPILVAMRDLLASIANEVAGRGEPTT